jgi:alginate O-acetyltransferase complex protein AlgI
VNLPFYSYSFAAFLALTLLVYWSLKPAGWRLQNILLLFASCVFYGWFDYRFAFLLLTGGLIDYLVGLGLMKTVGLGKRRALLGLSLAANLGMLAGIKYMSFFLPRWAALLHAAGLGADAASLSLVLPLGVSFFTLQRLSYTIEMYRGRLVGTRDIISYFAFACFFPLLLSGPIERAQRLLPQFQKERSIDSGPCSDALRLMLWGLFKKVVIADNLAGRVAFVFSDYDRFNGIDLAAGAFLFTIQLYADFSGYSDIAIGISRLFGFRIAKNFACPYFSRNMAEFWQRWHISLSTWFRDYIFTPLTMNVNIKAHMLRMGCILLNFTASGLWHGAAWHYLLWGALCGLGFAPLVFGAPPSRQSRQVAEGRMIPSIRESLQMALMFAYILPVWIVFRSSSVDHAVRFVIRMLTHSWLAFPGAGWLLLLAAAFLAFEWIRRETEHPLNVAGAPVVVQWIIYILLALSIGYFGRINQLDFIYTHF